MVKKHIAACIVRENEAKPLVLREELDSAVVHRAGHLATEALTGLRCANAGALGGEFFCDERGIARAAGCARRSAGRLSSLPCAPTSRKETENELYPPGSATDSAVRVRVVKLVHE